MWSLFQTRARREHQRASANLSAYLDDELDARERAFVRRHLETCAACRRDLATLRETSELLRGLPAMPLPRSFLLPSAAQAERARYRRWNTTYTVLRSGAVAVSFLLVLALSSDALLGKAYTSTASQRAPIAPQVLVQAPDEGAETLEASAPVMNTAETPEPESQVAALKTGETTAQADEVVPEVAVASASSAPAATVASAPPREMPRTAGGEPEQSASPTLDQEASPAEGFGGAGVGGAQESDTGGEAGATGGRAVGLPTPRPLGPKPTATPQATIVVTSEEAPQLAAVAPEQTPEPPSAEEVVPTQSFSSPLLGIWQVVRVITGVLAGLLLIFLAGLLWVGYNRRARR